MSDGKQPDVSKLQAEIVQPPGTGPESKEVNPVSKDVVDRILLEIGANDIPDGRKDQLARVLSGIDLADNKIQIEKNTLVLAIATEQLRNWGFTVLKPISRETLKIENDTDEQVARINELVTTKKMPTINYVSNVGIYNMDVSLTPEGRVKYEKSAISSLMDRIENLLRVSGDEGGNILTALFRTPKRRKASMNEIAKNVQELGLEGYFTVERQGNEVSSVSEDINDLKRGAFLDDLLRMQSGNTFLARLDPQEALKMTAQMIDGIHRKSGRGIGEVLANDIVLQVVDGKVVGVRLALPDVKYDNEVPNIEQKAYDILDLCFSVGSSGLQAGGITQANTNMKTILDNYPDAAVKAKMVELMAKGIPQNTVHNIPRLGFDRVQNKDVEFENIRKLCQNLLGVGSNF